MTPSPPSPPRQLNEGVSKRTEGTTTACAKVECNSGPATSSTARHYPAVGQAHSPTPRDTSSSANTATSRSGAHRSVRQMWKL